MVMSFAACGDSSSKSDSSSKASSSSAAESSSAADSSAADSSAADSSAAESTADSSAAGTNVEVMVRGDILDKSNILVDFKALKRDLRLILSELDHKDLNELPDFKDESPSSEFIANYIYYKMKEKYVELYRVSVWETQGSCATYYEAE